jgi:hypothetical protein
MLAHRIQLLQYMLSTSFLIYLVKHLKIWLDFLHIRVHVKHGIVPLVVRNIMCTRSPNIFTLPLENRQLAQWNFFYYVVPHCMIIHIVGAWEILAWEVHNLFTCECLRNTTLNPCLAAHYNSRFFSSLSWLCIHLNCVGPPILASQGKCTTNVASHWTMLAGIFFYLTYKDHDFLL